MPMHAVLCPPMVGHPPPRVRRHQSPTWALRYLCPLGPFPEHCQFVPNEADQEMLLYVGLLSLTSAGPRSAIEDRTFKHSYISACLDLGAHLWICFTSRVGVRRAPLSTIKSDRVGRPRPPPGGPTGLDMMKLNSNDNF